MDNRPGLSAISYRAGTYGSFLRAMINRIARYTHPLDPDYPWVIRDLQTRAADDYAITFLQMWATVADILCFYDERFANEGFLRTATQRDSVLRLARLVGYELRPGVAATTLLAFTLDTAARVVLPVGLRVQSVPTDGETPQKFETRRSLNADGRLNRVVVSARPARLDPFAVGNSAAFLAPGDAGLRAAAALRAGDHVLRFDTTTAAAPESLVVGGVTAARDLVELSWATPMASSMPLTGTADIRRYDRVLRIFGHNAPQTTMTATSDGATPPTITWDLQTTDFTYPSTAASTLESATSLLFDGRYDGLKIGNQLLVTQPGAAATLVAITGVDQVTGDFAGVADSATRVTLSATTPLPAIPRRREALVYELTGDTIPFWGWTFGDRLLGGSCWTSGRRTGWTTIEIGRRIVGAQYVAGVEIDVREIEIGRATVLVDGQGSVFPASIADVYVAGTNLRLGPSPTDSTTASLLGLTAANALRVTALASGSLKQFPTLQATAPELLVTIGPVGPRRVPIVAPTSLQNLAATLEQGIRSADPAPEFAKARVRAMGNRITIVAGLPDAPMRISPTSTDPSTALVLKLDPTEAEYVDGILSASLDEFAGLGAGSPQIAATLGADDPTIVTLAAPFGTAADACVSLRQALGVGLPNTLVELVDGRLLVLPALSDHSTQSFLVVDIDADGEIDVDAASAVLLGNVAAATHGETVRGEIVGSADASLSFQRFTLAKTPLTYVPGAGPNGAASTLQVLVNGVQWQEVPTLFGRSPDDQVFITRLADDATTAVEFGDGATGARPPSGADNVVARYRKGSGLAGRLRAGALSSLLDRPVGVRGVLNPAATDGGADAETAADTRRNAPTTVRTFDRAVSLQDFVDLVMASGEVAKATAGWVWRGDTRCIYLTVAAQLGGFFSRDGLARLHATLTAERDPNHPLSVENFVRVPIVVAATLHVQANHVTSAVLDAARTALCAALGFDTMPLARPLHLSRVYEVLQDVDGVGFVDITTLQFKNHSADYLASRGADAAPVQGHLRVFPARVVDGEVTPAEQAWIESSTQDITLLASGGLPD